MNRLKVRMHAGLLMAAVMMMVVMPFSSSADATSSLKKPIQIKRTLLALYSSKDSDGAMNSLNHMFLEMPANHLGLNMHYVDVEKPLPEVGEDVRGIVVWLAAGRYVKNPSAYLDWLEAAMHRGVKIIIMENLGIGDDLRLAKGGMERLNSFLFQLGMKDLNSWSSITYASEIIDKDKKMIEFERPLPKALPPYLGTVAITGRSVSHLRVRTHVEPEYVSDLVITSPKGGYVAGGYAIFEGYPLISIETEAQKKYKAANKGKVVAYEQIVKKDKNGTPVAPSSAAVVNTLTPKKKLGEAAPSVAMKAMPLVTGEDATGKHSTTPTPVDKFAVVEDNIDPLIQQWYIDPFLFLKTTLDIHQEPIADVTTVNGKRVFYSHIDGDGWNNISEIERYKRQRAISAEVIKEEILKAYPDIPTSVSVIAGEMEDDCYGRPESARIAKEIFALPNVEPASHTYTHPLYWQYFADHDVAKEVPLLGMYPEKPASKKGLYSTLMGQGKSTDGWESYFKQHPEMEAKKSQKSDFNSRYYETPRSFACGPYDIHREIEGAAKVVNALAPTGKRVRLVQWSGNTSPYEEALRVTREAGFANINGGDSRFDMEYPSYTSVSPIGLEVGQERQIYSSNSNENTYTNLWTDRFFGFKYLRATAENTDHPKRVQPFNVYYHVYSGQKQASLTALKDNFDFARTQDIIPMMAADFAMMANDFYHVKIQQLGDGHYKIINRGHVATIRFDDAALLAVDMEHSSSVLGFRYLQGSLYVALDPSKHEAEILLTQLQQVGYYPESSKPYLIDSRWLINNLTFINNSLMFTTQGYGRGAMKWHVPVKGKYSLEVNQNNKTILTKLLQTDEDSILDVDLKSYNNALLNIKITRIQE